MSCTVPLRAWPMCSSPVTFGGGRQIVYLGLGLRGSAVKSPAFSQRAYQPASMALGSNAVSISDWVLLMGVLPLEAGMGAPAGGRLERPRRLAYSYGYEAAHGVLDLSRRAPPVWQGRPGFNRPRLGSQGLPTVAGSD